MKKLITSILLGITLLGYSQKDTLRCVADSCISELYNHSITINLLSDTVNSATLEVRKTRLGHGSNPSVDSIVYVSIHDSIVDYFSTSFDSLLAVYSYDSYTDAYGIYTLSSVKFLYNDTLTEGNITYSIQEKSPNGMIMRTYENYPSLTEGELSDFEISLKSSYMIARYSEIFEEIVNP